MEQDSVRKWDGLLRTCWRGAGSARASLSMAAKRIAFPILAWFFRPTAEMSVDVIARRTVRSREPADTRSS